MIIKCDPGSHRIKSGRIDVLVKDTILRFRKRDTQLNQLRIIYFIYLKKRREQKSIAQFIIMIDTQRANKWINIFIILLDMEIF